MSVIVKDMKMPLNCEKCIYSGWSNFYQIYVCNAAKRDEPVLFDGKQTKSTAVVRSARADNCPLVPVPPHGDLIDRNDIKDRVSWCTTINHALIECDRAPTIIPADGKNIKVIKKEMREVCEREMIYGEYLND